MMRIACSFCLSENITRLLYYVNRPGEYLVLVVEGYDLTLAEYINNFGPMKYEEAKTSIGICDTATIFSQIFKGVAYMHEKGFVHCDINCGNIFIQTGLLAEINI